jgi:hypothetical protein
MAGSVTMTSQYRTLNRASALTTLVLIMTAVIGYAVGAVHDNLRNGARYAGVVTAVNGRATSGCVVPLTGSAGGEWCGYFVGDGVLLTHVRQGQHVHAVLAVVAGDTVLAITP